MAMQRDTTYSSDHVRN